MPSKLPSLTRRTMLGTATLGAMPIILSGGLPRKAFSATAPLASFDTVAAMLRDTSLDPVRVGPGLRIQASGFEYETAPHTAVDHQLKTAGGLKLYVRESVIRPEQFGVEGDRGDELSGLQAVLDFAAGRGPVHISRRHYIRPTGTVRGLSVHSHTRILFENGGAIENLPHDCIQYEMLKIHDVIDVEVVDAVLDGRRDLNAATTGEWGNGIQILGNVDAIRIRNPTTNNMWGDGIFIGQDLLHGGNPRSVEVWAPRADNCRRQGMSITSAHRCVVHDPVWTNTNGTQPQAGLDIEPDTETAVLGDIQVLNPQTRNNAGAGIMVFLGPLRNTSSPVSITITHHDSRGDACGAQFMRAGGDDSFASGSIRYLDPVVKKAKVAGIAVEDWDVRGPDILLTNPVIVDPGAMLGTSDRDRAGILIFNDQHNQAGTIGNVVVTGASIVYTRNTSDIDRYFYVQNYKHSGQVSDVKILDPVKLEGARYSRIDGKVTWSDRNQVSTANHADPSYPFPIINWAFGGRYTNSGADGAITFELPGDEAETPVGWPDVTVDARGAHPIRINPGTGNTIVQQGRRGEPLEIGAGERITLRRRSSTEWMIVPATAP